MVAVRLAALTLIVALLLSLQAYADPTGLPYALPNPVIDTYCASDNLGEQAVVILVLPPKSSRNGVVYFRTSSTSCQLSATIGSTGSAGGNISWTNTAGTCLDGSTPSILSLSYIPSTLTFSIVFRVSGISSYDWYFQQVATSRCLLTQLPPKPMCGMTDDGQFAMGLSPFWLMPQTSAAMPVQASLAVASPFALLQANTSFGYITIDGNLVLFPIAASIQTGSLSLIRSTYDGVGTVTVNAVLNGNYYVFSMTTSQCSELPAATLCGMTPDQTAFASASFTTSGGFQYAVQSLAGAQSCSNIASQALLVGSTVVLPQGYSGNGRITTLQFSASGVLTLTVVCNSQSLVTTLSAAQCGTLPSGSFAGTNADLGITVGFYVQAPLYPGQPQQISRGLISYTGSYTETAACAFSASLSSVIDGMLFLFPSFQCTGITLQNATYYNGQLLVYGALSGGTSFAVQVSASSALATLPFCAVTSSAPVTHAVLKVSLDSSLAVFSDIGGSTLSSNCQASSSTYYVVPSTGHVLSSFSGFCNSSNGASLVTSLILNSNGQLSMTLNTVAFTLNTGLCTDPLSLASNTYCGSSTAYNGMLTISGTFFPVQGWTFGINVNTPQSNQPLVLSCQVTSQIFMIISGTVVTLGVSYTSCPSSELVGMTYSAANGFTATDSGGNSLSMTTGNCNPLPAGSYCSSSGTVQGGILIETSVPTETSFYLSGSGTIGTQFALCSNFASGMVNIAGKIFFLGLPEDSCTSSITSISFTSGSLSVATAGGTSTFTSAAAGQCGAIPNGQYCGSGNQRNLIVNVSGYTMQLYLATLQTSSITCTGSTTQAFLAGTLVFSSGFQLTCSDAIQSLTFSSAAFAIQIGSESFTNVNANNCQSLPSQPVCGTDSMANSVKLYWPGVLFGVGFRIACNTSSFMPIGAVGGNILYLPEVKFFCDPYVFTINSLTGGNTQSVTLNFNVQYMSDVSLNTSIVLGPDLCGAVPTGQYCVTGANKGNAVVTRYGGQQSDTVIGLLLAPQSNPVPAQTTCTTMLTQALVIGTTVLTSKSIGCPTGSVNVTYTSATGTLTAQYLPTTSFSVPNPQQVSFGMTFGTCLSIPTGTYCGSAGTGNVIVMDINGTMFSLLLSIGGSIIGPSYGQLATMSDGSIIMSFSMTNQFNVTIASFNGGSITLTLASQSLNFAFSGVQLYTGGCGVVPPGQYCGSTLTFSASASVAGKNINVSVMQGNGGTSQICWTTYYGVNVAGTFLALYRSGNCFSYISSITWLPAQTSLVLTANAKPNLVLSTDLCSSVPAGFYCGRAPFPIADTEAVVQVTDAGVLNMWIYSGSKMQVLSWPSSLLWQHQVVIDYSWSNGFGNAVKKLTYSDGALTLSANPSWASFSFTDLVMHTGSCPWISLSSPSSSLGFAQTTLSISPTTYSMSSVFCSASQTFVGAVTLENGLVQFLVSPSEESSSGEVPLCVQQGVLGGPYFVYNSPATSTVVVASSVLNFPGTWVLGSGSATGGNGAPTSNGGAPNSSNDAPASGPSVAVGILSATLMLLIGGGIFYALKAKGMIPGLSGAANNTGSATSYQKFPPPASEAEVPMMQRVQAEGAQA
jgi:hypothetical protein